MGNLHLSCYSYIVCILFLCFFGNSFIGVYLSLNDVIIPNHGYVMISDIGSTNDNALLCITNRPATFGSNSGGDWFAPDGDEVGSFSDPNVQGFGRNRAPMLVRLLNKGGTPEQGIYYCVVDDTGGVTQTVYVGLYNSGGGNKGLTCCNTFALGDHK